MWELYNHFKNETQLKELFKAKVKKLPNPVNSLMTAFIIYSHNFLVLSKHPQSFVQQLRSRLLDYIDEHSPMISLLNNEQHLATIFTNNIKRNRKDSRPCLKVNEIYNI